MAIRIRTRRRLVVSAKGRTRRSDSWSGEDPFPALLAETHPLPAWKSRHRSWSAQRMSRQKW
jgi:hypothetical protein